jgi:dihydroorotate dehydrogenase
MYKLIYSIFLKFLNPEFAHKCGIAVLKLIPFLLKQNLVNHNINFFNQTIKNKVGIGAGFDKNGEAISGLFNAGFGFVEIGTVTPIPQSGNPKPRVFRVGKDGIINRMGFPNFGADVVLKNLQNFNKIKKVNEVVGVNIGRNKEGTADDYLFLIEKFIKDADYITINVSSPNTPNLRSLLQKEPLAIFLQKIANKRKSLAIKKPFFLKISPDIEITDLEFIYDLIIKNHIEGIIISNTTVSRPSSLLKNMNETGGLSGNFLKQKSLELLKEWNKLNKAKIVTISVGGIETKNDVKERLKNGADFIQIYTSFVYNGIKIVKELSDL